MDINQIINRDDQICRYSLLNLGVQKAEICNRGYGVPMVYFPVAGIQAYWKDQTLSAQQNLFRFLLASMMQGGSRISFMIRGDRDGIHLYYGCAAGDGARLEATLRGLFPGIQLGKAVEDRQMPTQYGISGVMIGQPGDLDTERYTAEAFRFPVDVLCSSMLGAEFTVCVLAEKFGSDTLMNMLTKIRMEEQEYSRYQTMELQDGKQRQENKLVQDYIQHLDMAARDLRLGIQEGMWSAAVYYGAQEMVDLIRLESILKSAWMGNRDEVYQPLHCIPLECDRHCCRMGSEGYARMSEEVFADCACQSCLSVDQIPGYDDCVMANDGKGYGTGTIFNGYRYRTALTGSQLANYCQLPRHEFPGYAVNPYVEFDTAKRTNVKPEQAVRLGNIVRVDQLNEKHTMRNPYTLPIDDLSRHMLLVGITGGGKSNTTKAILSELWGKHRLPFLVIESAKREYHELMNVTQTDADGRTVPLFPEISLFTLGNENPVTGIPYRLNPFEVMPGCSIQTHIDSVLSTFNAAFDMFSPLPQVLEAMVYEVYDDRGWDIVNNTNRFGAKSWPTLTDLYYKIDPVTDKQGYNKEISDNVKAALRVRLNSLRMGSKGAMLDVPRSTALKDLLKMPTVLELEDLGDDNSKAFVIGILMVQLYEFRKSGATSKNVLHLLIIEEAHRLLKKVVPGSGDQSREKAVSFFCDMLSEIRSYGQAIQICDQVPTRLADDALKNTNCKIVHRTVMEEDRTAVGRAMHMNEEQIDFLSSLPRGCAAIYAEGDSRPKLVRFPLVLQKGTLTRAQLLEKCRKEVQQRYAQSFRVYKYSHACRFCESSSCAYRSQCEDWVNRLDMNLYWSLLTANNQKLTFTSMLRMCRRAENDMGQKLGMDKELCFMGLAMEKFPMKDLQRALIMTQYYVKRGKWIAEQAQKTEKKEE